MATLATTQTNDLFNTLAEITKPVNLLEHLQGKAIQAHYWTSFDPEKRGQQLINDYNNQLNEDMQELEGAGIGSEAINSYKARYEQLFSSWLNAKGNCISSMITGPARFPTRKAEKANRSEHNHYTLWQEWRKRAKAAIVRKSQPAKTFLSELDRYKAELSALKTRHELTKQGNKIIAKAQKSGEDITKYLTDTFNVQPHMIDWVKKFGFNTVNSNASVKRIEGRIKEVEAKENQREVNPVTKYSFEGGEMVINYEVDRIQVFFATRPTSSELMAWKAKGLSSFNWSHTNKAWQRKITANAMYSVKHMFTGLTKIS